VDLLPRPQRHAAITGAATRNEMPADSALKSLKLIFYYRCSRPGSEV
jgi:hypothetical protein